MIRQFSRKWKIIFVPLAVTALIGAAKLAEPIDLVHEMLANKARLHATSGQVAVIGIEEAAPNGLGNWPWSGQQIADLTETLFENGAETVTFHAPIRAQNDIGDQAFIDVVSRHPGQVFTVIDTDVGHSGPGQQIEWPMKALDGKAETLVGIHDTRFWNGVERFSYASEVEGRTLASVASKIAGSEGAADGSIRVDYALDVSSFPYASAASVLNGNPAVIEVANGRHVLVGFSAHSRADKLEALGQGPVASVFVIALGIETALKGDILMWNWWPLWVLAALVMLTTLSMKSRRLSWGINLTTIGLLLVAPGVLAVFDIYALASPALFLSLWTQLLLARRLRSKKDRDSGAINPISGLKTLNAIRHEDRLANKPLVSARVRRYTDIVSTLSPESERQLVTDILARLRLGAGQAEIFHGDDGNLYWLSDIEDPAVLIQQLESLRAIFREAIFVEERRFSIDVSYGIDLQFDVALSHRLKSALAAALSAEADGVNLMLHDPMAQNEKAWALSMLAELDTALDEGQFWVAYQPQMDLRTGEITSAEALARWTHETRGPISPSEFVTVAEQHGRIDRLTACVIEDAMSVLMRVQQTKPDFSMSVNLSPSLLQSTEVLETLTTLLLQYPIDPSRLILEVTETLEFGENDLPFTVMNALREMGVGLSIDDYGTGHSTLDYLRKIPATEVKIDRSFVEHVSTSREDQVVIASSIELARAMGMKIVAEGIESKAALILLSEMGCDFGQGYHIARPMRESDFLGVVVGDPDSRKTGSFR